jgi:hypothetical protein
MLHRTTNSGLHGFVGQQVLVVDNQVLVLEVAS